MKKIEHKVIRELNKIFSCAVSALSSTVTKFENVGVKDIYEANFVSDFYASTLNTFGDDAVEVEVPYPNKNSNRKCDLVIYSDDDRYSIWIEVKYWASKSDSKVIQDIEKIREIPEISKGKKNYRLVATYWYEDKDRDLYESPFSRLLGLDQVGMYIDENFCWFALMPGTQDTNIKRDHFCGLSIYLVKEND